MALINVHRYQLRRHGRRQDEQHAHRAAPARVAQQHLPPADLASASLACAEPPRDGAAPVGASTADVGPTFRRGIVCFGDDLARPLAALDTDPPVLPSSPAPPREATAAAASAISEADLYAEPFQQFNKARLPLRADAPTLPARCHGTGAVQRHLFVLCLLVNGTKAQKLS